MIPKIDKKITVTDCPDYEGHRAVVQHIGMQHRGVDETASAFYSVQSGA